MQGLSITFPLSGSEQLSEDLTRSIRDAYLRHLDNPIEIHRKNFKEELDDIVTRMRTKEFGQNVSGSIDWNGSSYMANVVLTF